jgi:hypothetical protein
MDCPEVAIELHPSLVFRTIPNADQMLFQTPARLK